METKMALSNFALLLFLCFFTVAISATNYENSFSCVYTVFVRTSKTTNAGTDSKISLSLYDQTGDGILIKDLEAWGGAMEVGHDYYEKGNLDIFTGRGSCLSGQVCSMELTSDGSGAHHGWYCNYVEVTTTGPNAKCGQTKFTVEQWLALDRSPRELTAVRDNCFNGNLNGVRKTLVPVETLLATSAL